MGKNFKPCRVTGASSWVHAAALLAIQIISVVSFCHCVSGSQNFQGLRSLKNFRNVSLKAWRFITEDLNPDDD